MRYIYRGPKIKGLDEKKREDLLCSGKGGNTVSLVNTQRALKVRQKSSSRHSVQGGAEIKDLKERTEAKRPLFVGCACAIFVF